MAITTYAELQAAAANWLVRGDLTARIPEFIALAEARLNRLLRARLAETEAALYGVAGARSVPLPPLFVEPLTLWIVRTTGRDRLRFTEPGLMQAGSARGEPGAWGIDGANLSFDRPCDQAYPFVLRYLARFALSDAAPTNALLTSYPDAYLFATLAEAGPFLRDAELAGACEARLERAIAEINARDARAKSAARLGVEAALRAQPHHVHRGT